MGSGVASPGSGAWAWGLRLLALEHGLGSRISRLWSVGLGVVVSSSSGAWSMGSGVASPGSGAWARELHLLALEREIEDCGARA